VLFVLFNLFFLLLILAKRVNTVPLDFLHHLLQKEVRPSPFRGRDQEEEKRGRGRIGSSPWFIFFFEE